MASDAGAATGTRERLLDAAATVVRERGLADASARAIAAQADVNQALIFYHFGSVNAAIAAASDRAVAVSVAAYRDDFAAAHSLGELLQVGRRVHAGERANGNVALMAQLMAGAQRDDQLRTAAASAMDAWVGAIEPPLTRLLPTTPLAGAVDARGLARAIATGFVGLELYSEVDPDGAGGVLEALEQLGLLLEAVGPIGPVGAAAIRARQRIRRGATREEDRSQS